MAQVKERGGRGALVSFLAWSKPEVSFHDHFLLRNQTETLATQANADHVKRNVTIFNPYYGSL